MTEVGGMFKGGGVKREMWVPWRYALGTEQVGSKQNNDPWRCLGLIPRTCDYVTLHGQGDCVDVIKSANLEMGRLSWITKWV